MGLVEWGWTPGAVSLVMIWSAAIPAKCFWTPSEESPPLLPLFQCCSNDVDFSFDFFQPAKQHWAGGMGEKGSHCPMLLSEIVA